MDYLLVFLEGILTFVSPCMLPLVPVYVFYFTGGEAGRRRTLTRALGFVLGFTLVFVLLGAFAGTLGSLLIKGRRTVEWVSGLFMIAFGLSFMGLFRFSLPFASRLSRPEAGGFIPSLLFGLIFSLAWTPCVGAMLGSALTMAAARQSATEGVFMLLLYSAGLGIPFVAASLLFARLKGAFDFLKKHTRTINIVSGALLIAVGILMVTGLFAKLMGLVA